MRRLIIDTDAGVDDAQAILLALAHPEVKVEAITTVNGNVGVDKTTANVLKILDIAQKDIPVFPGCSRPLINEAHHAAYVHGKDGLGDCGIPPSKRKLQKEHAAHALIRLAKENEGELILVAIGPLTNLAVAVQMDPQLPKRFKRLVIMGGTIYGKGNTNITAEFNVYTDPEAAQIIFNSWGKLTMLSWETTLEHVFNKADLQRFFSLDTPKAKFFHDTNQIILDFVKSRLEGKEMLFAPDGLAMAAAIEPEIVKKAEEHYVSVELRGQFTRGQTNVDWFNASQKPANAEIILEVDHERFKTLMENGLK